MGAATINFLGPYSLNIREALFLNVKIHPFLKERYVYLEDRDVAI